MLGSEFIEKNEPVFCESSLKIIDRLSVIPEKLPLDTDGFVKEVGVNACNKLVEELIDQGLTKGQFFADAMSLVKVDEVSATVRKWLETQGLTILVRENIKINLLRKSDGNFTGCHEVGQFLVFGTVNAQDVPRIPEQVSKNTFTVHEGPMAEVNIWDAINPRLQYTVVGKYVAGNGPNARGIMVPDTDTPTVYTHTKNSYKKGESRNFYIKQYGMHNYAWSGLAAVGRYLKGEIPAV